MALISQLRRLARRLFPVDEFHSRGVPRPIGSVGRQAGIWIAYHLDGSELAYLVAGGPSSTRPIAIVFGSDDDRLTADDFRLAKRIAGDWNLAAATPEQVFDARGIDMRNPYGVEFIGSPAWFVFNTVLFPTDRFGLRVDDPRCHFRSGAMFSLGGGLFIACDPTAIPWHSNARRSSPLPQNIPTFDMKIDGDWNPAPVGLAEFIDRVNKNGRVKSTIVTPEKSDDREAFGTAA